MDRAFVQVFIDGKPEPLQISYSRKKMGEDITKKVVNLRQKIINTFWRKLKFEEKNSIKIFITLLVDDEKATFDIEIPVKDRKAQDIEKELITKVIEKTHDIMYRLSYLLILSEEYMEQD